MAIMRCLARIGLSLVFACYASLAVAVPSEISAQQLLTPSVVNPLILDVRTAGEFDAGHVPGAINIPYDQLAAHAEQLPQDKNARLVVYCRSGHRAAIAIKTLTQAGYQQVQHLKGDMIGWTQAHLPVTQGH